MAIKVGNSWVTEEAYAWAKGKAGAASQETDELNQLAEKFPEAHFSSNTAPFRGKGVHNIAISPNILRQMKNDPEKRLEFEALIYDCDNLQKSLGRQSGRIKAQGFIINSDGTLGSWSISESKAQSNRNFCLLPKNQKGGWLKKILGGGAASAVGAGRVWRA